MLHEVAGFLHAVESARNHFVGADHLQPSAVDDVAHGGLDALHLIAQAGRGSSKIFCKRLQIAARVVEDCSSRIECRRGAPLQVAGDALHPAAALLHTDIKRHQHAGLDHHCQGGDHDKDDKQRLHKWPELVNPLVAQTFTIVQSRN